MPSSPSRRAPPRSRPSRNEPEAAPDPLGVAVRALKHRDLSAHELAERLTRRGVPPAQRREVIERLARAGYVDDARFARSRARVLADRGLGDAAIRADLEERGIDADAASDALAALEPEPERARVEAARLGGGVRAARALARKGFAGASVEAAVALADTEP